MIARLAFIETPRLIMREMLPLDAPDFFALNSDTDVIKYTGDDPFHSVEDCREFLENYPLHTYEKCGYGRWTCLLKESEENLGWCGIRLQDDEQVDLGYRFHKRFWNAGLATEASFASLKLAFDIFRLREVYARANQDNPASVRVMQKTGMEFLKKTQSDVFYSIDKKNFICPFEVKVYLK
jgi:RimJ/RimL family protein N-acetyltransferase